MDGNFTNAEGRIAVFTTKAVPVKELPFRSHPLYYINPLLAKMAQVYPSLLRHLKSRPSNLKNLEFTLSTLL
jgi:hypothetical protein